LNFNISVEQLECDDLQQVEVVLINSNVFMLKIMRKSLMASPDGRLKLSDINQKLILEPVDQGLPKSNSDKKKDTRTFYKNQDLQKFISKQIEN
jgi:hypothetical protein